MNPINYIQPQTPLFSGLAQGLEVGNAIVAMKQQAEQRQAMIQKAAEDEAKKQQFVADTDAYFRNPTYENGARLIAAHPQMKETLKAAVGNMQEGQKQEKFGFGLKLENALESKDINTAMALIDERRTAYKNKGLDTTELDEMYDGLKDGEGDDVLGLTRINLFGLDEKKYNEIQKGKRESAMTGIDTDIKKAELAQKEAGTQLTQQQITQSKILGGKISAETDKILRELEAAKSGATVDPKEIFKQEEKLRKEYTDRIKPFTEANATYANIASSAKDKTGAGDIALVTSFMKMLDPGSVVRETEFANARDTAGLRTRLENAAQKLNNGQFLTDAQRLEYSSLAKKYFEASEKTKNNVTNDMNKIIQNYKLNPENIISNTSSITIDAPANIPTPPPGAVRKRS